MSGFDCTKPSVCLVHFVRIFRPWLGSVTDLQDAMGNVDEATITTGSSPRTCLHDI